MALLIENFSCFLVELTGFLLCLMLVKKLQPKSRLVMFFFGLVVICVQLVWQIGFRKTENVSILALFTFPLICKPQKWKSTYVFCLIAMLLETFCYGITVYLVEVFTGYKVGTNNGEMVNVLCLLIFPIGVILYYIVEKKFFDGKIELVFLKEQKITFVIVLLSGIHTILMHSLMSIKDARAEVRVAVSGITLIAIMIVYLITFFWQGRAMWKNQQLLYRQSMYSYLTKSQQQYIDYVIKCDDNLRKFRHDVRAHMIIMKSLAQKGDMEGILSYIDEVNNMTNLGQNRQFTGNSTLDAIINDLQRRMSYSDIRLKVVGQLHMDKEDRVFDISICMYNILLNAIEALEKSRTEEKNINVEIKEYQKKVYIKISNKCNICGDKEDIKELITDKKDVCNHGIGSKNIADIVKKNDGKVIYSVKNGWFITELLI